MGTTRVQSIVEPRKGRSFTPLCFRDAATIALWLPIWTFTLSLPLLLLNPDNGWRVIFVLLLFPLMYGGVSFVAFAIGGTVYLRRCTLGKIPRFSIVAPWIHAGFQFCVHVLAVLSGSELLMDAVLTGVGSAPETELINILLFAMVAILIGYLYVALAWFLLFFFAGACLTEWVGGRMWED